MSDPTLIQIPFSHNCVKVRVALALKGVRYVTRDIAPTSRGEVREASGQGLVPVLLVDGRAITDSTAIVLFLESRHPDPPLVPGDPALRADCLLLEDWADRAFMALSRRISYASVLARPGALGSLFFPKDAAAARWVKERIARRIVAKRFGISPRCHVNDLTEARRLAAIANARLGRRRWLTGDRPTIADVALATMSALLAADPECRSDREVGALLAWGEALVPADVAAVYRG
jgi:glutathione S-transferase